jgi:hypothetical protein
MFSIEIAEKGKLWYQKELFQASKILYKFYINSVDRLINNCYYKPLIIIFLKWSL